MSGSLSYIVLGSFELDYSTRTVSFTYILLSICATVFAACPVDTSEMVVSGVSGACAGDVAVVIWFGTLLSRFSVLTGSSFTVAFVSFELRVLSKLVCLIASFCLSGSRWKKGRRLSGIFLKF